MKLTVAEQALRTGLRSPLPGHDAFLELSGYKRPDLEAAMRLDPPPRESAVLILLYPNADEAYTLLMRRPTYPGVHSGQIAFPGGRREPADPDLRSTALREFLEETGAQVEATLLGALSPIYIPPSRSLVTPYVAVTPRLGPLSPDPREVAALLEVPLELLLRDDILRRREQHVAIMDRKVQVPYFDVQGEVVWGATAMMIAELRAILGRHGQPA
ncbi:MAG: CoA pyrophosphatase [Flavobacteriales bacterium]|nr:CoA pyrophosphatase [Flavobacteriales bacterium]